ncbi:MAG: serine hydrolase domain-containing protein, partial [Gemmatimonadota bacterium]
GEPGATATPDVSPALGHPDSVLIWTAAERRAGFQRYDHIFPTRAIPASPERLALPPATTPWPADIDIDGFMEHDSVMGLIVVRGGEVLAERYRAGHAAETRWVSYSISKSLVSMLVGAAIQDGYIASVDDPVTRYVPLLRESAYDGVTIEDVLTMSSGVAWNEDYGDPESDVSQEIHYDAVERLRFLGDRERVAPPGTRFNYSTGEIFLAGAVVRGAVGNNLSAYLARRIWEPYGMEDDASWMLVEPGGPEYAGCCISATLRDYARIGMVALSDGVAPDGTRVLPEGWMAESTTPSPANPGYGYLWWLHDDGSFSARGIFGQLIHVDPALDLVVAMHGLWPEPVSEERGERRERFLEELKGALGGR